MCGQTYSWMRTQLQLLTSQINLNTVHASCQPVKLIATVSKWMRYYLKAAETWFYRGIMKTPWGNESFMKKLIKAIGYLNKKETIHILWTGREKENIGVCCDKRTWQKKTGRRCQAVAFWHETTCIWNYWLAVDETWWPKLHEMDY